jgi:hypothetical protein
MSFAALRKNKTNVLAALQKKAAEAAGGQGGGSRDDRFWKPSYDKNTKVGSATIRFLPWGAMEGELPWVEWIEFSFKGKGGNYWNRSLRSLGKDDPVAELNHLQWERNTGNDQDEVKKRGRRLRYVANIVVINDPAHPENNGKNFLWEFGPAIHKKIMAKMAPEYEDQMPINVFDMDDGAHFRVRTKDKSGYLNYDDSEFDAPSLLHNDDAVLEKIYDGMIDLKEFTAEDKYKSYDDLKAQLIKVLGAQYCASITGESYTAGQVAGAGGNPFEAQQQAPAQQQQQAPVDNDPFANAGSAPADSDPFATQDQQQQAPADEDPFANASSSAAGADEDDPFADMSFD